MVTGTPPASRDVVRSLFGIAAALGLAAVLLREIHEVRLLHGSLAFVWFSSWFAGALSVAASLADAAKTRRQRSLYFAAAVVAGQLLAFQDEMDDGVASLLVGLLWALLAAVIVTEAWSLLRSDLPPDDLDVDTESALPDAADSE